MSSSNEREKKVRSTVLLERCARRPFSNGILCQLFEFFSTEWSPVFVFVTSGFAYSLLLPSTCMEIKAIKIFCKSWFPESFRPHKKLWVFKFLVHTYTVYVINP